MHHFTSYDATAVNWPAEGVYYLSISALLKAFLSATIVVVQAQDEMIGKCTHEKVIQCIESEP